MSATSLEINLVVFDMDGVLVGAELKSDAHAAVQRARAARVAVGQILFISRTISFPNAVRPS